MATVSDTDFEIIYISLNILLKCSIFLDTVLIILTIETAESGNKASRNFSVIFIINLSKSAGASIRISPPKVILGKDVLKICRKVIGGHPCRSVISVKLQSKSIQITLRHGCSPVNVLHIFTTHFPKSTYGGLLLK